MNPRGFTLIEVLLSVAVFSIGALVISTAFFKTADLINAIDTRFPAELLCHNLMIEAQEKFQQVKVIESMTKNQKVTQGSQPYDVKYDFRQLDGSKKLYQMTTTLEWSTKRKNILKRDYWLLLK